MGSEIEYLQYLQTNVVSYVSHQLACMSTCTTTPIKIFVPRNSPEFVGVIITKYVFIGTFHSSLLQSSFSFFIDGLNSGEHIELKKWFKIEVSQQEEWHYPRNSKREKKVGSFIITLI